MQFSEAIKDLSDTFIAAHKRGDVAGCIAAYAEDCVLLAPGKEPIRGHRALAEIFAEDINAGQRVERLITQEADADGNVGYAIQTVESTSGTFTVLLVCRRDASGSWKVKTEAVVV